jgi:hypothetical protein
MMRKKLYNLFSQPMGDKNKKDEITGCGPHRER